MIIFLLILKGFKVAYIVFKKESSLQKALQLDSSELRYFSTEDKPVETGINSMFLSKLLCYTQTNSQLTDCTHFGIDSLSCDAPKRALLYHLTLANARQLSSRKEACTYEITFIMLSEWCKEYASNYPNPTKLQKEINEFMDKFDKKQEEV